MKKRRNQPLFSMEEILRRNGVKYDTSHASDFVCVVDENGNHTKLDSSFNLFEKHYLPPSFSFSSSSTIKNNHFSIPKYSTKQLSYKKSNDISPKIDCHYNSSPNTYTTPNQNLCTAA